MVARTVPRVHGDTARDDPDKHRTHHGRHDHRDRVGQQTQPERAGVAGAGRVDEFGAGSTRPLRPVTTGGIGEGQQGFAHVGGPVADALRQHRVLLQRLGVLFGPGPNAVAELVAGGCVHALAERFNSLVRRTTTHRDHNGPPEDRVRQEIVDRPNGLLVTSSSCSVQRKKACSERYRVWGGRSRARTCDPLLVSFVHRGH